MTASQISALTLALMAVSSPVWALTFPGPAASSTEAPQAKFADPDDALAAVGSSMQDTYLRDNAIPQLSDGYADRWSSPASAFGFGAAQSWSPGFQQGGYGPQFSAPTVIVQSTRFGR